MRNEFLFCSRPLTVALNHSQAEESQKKRRAQEGSDKGDVGVRATHTHTLVRRGLSFTPPFYCVLFSSASSSASRFLPCFLQHRAAALLWHFHPRPPVRPAESDGGADKSLDGGNGPEGKRRRITLCFFFLNHFPSSTRCNVPHGSCRRRCTWLARRCWKKKRSLRTKLWRKWALISAWRPAVSQSSRRQSHRVRSHFRIWIFFKKSIALFFRNWLRARQVTVPLVVQDEGRALPWSSEGYGQMGFAG